MVVSAISMCVCSLAKSFKDAQNYITPVMLIIMIPNLGIPISFAIPAVNVIKPIDISIEIIFKNAVTTAQNDTATR